MADAVRRVTLDDLLELVAAEPERAVRKTVRDPSPQTMARASKPGGMSLADFVSARAAGTAQRTRRFRRVVGAPASATAIDAWKRAHPAHPLPRDLEELVGRANGLHLWANAETKRSYFGLAPIEEWALARVKIYGAGAHPELLDDRYVAISYHEDAAAFVVLNASSGAYYLMDSAGPDESTTIGASVEELLGWIWRNRIEPR